MLTELSERSAELVETLENHGGDLDNGGAHGDPCWGFCLFLFYLF